MTLKAKIYTGFAVIVVLAIANGTLGYLAVHRLNAATIATQKVAAINASALKIDRDVHEIRLRVNRYVSTGHESSIASINDLQKTLEQRISLTMEAVDSEHDALLADIEHHLLAYTDRFDSVVAERRIRETLVKEELPVISDRVLALLKLPGSSRAETPMGQESMIALMECLSSFSQAERLFLRYFDTPDSMLVTTALKHLNHAIAEAVRLSEGDRSIEGLVISMSSFKQVAMRAVQATRSYLFFVNVVMAGESAEVSYRSNQLRKQLDSRQQEILAQVERTTDNVSRIAGFSIASVISLALIISIGLARSIVPPIAKLTHTFEQLADGLTDLSLPETGRNDEIGRMASAAMVFSEQNFKNLELLKEYEALSKRLTQKAEELEATNADLDNFAYVASHDLKSPLRGIRQLAEWVQEDAEHLLPEEDLKHLEVLQGRISKMELLLDDLLEYSRVGRMQAEHEQIDTEELVNNLIPIIDNPKAIDIRLTGRFPDIETIRTPLEQVLLNLISNAVKHHDKQSEGYVEVTCDLIDDECVFSIRDNGPGIDEKHHERIFQIYQRVGDSNTQGSGMGLAIVKKQVEMFGGSVKVDSAIGRGANFTFSWNIHNQLMEQSL